LAWLEIAAWQVLGGCCNILEIGVNVKFGMSKKLDLNLSAHEVIKDVFLFPFPSS
jgi:hypothetical protein